MFRAALETLYDGTGMIVYRADIPMEPTAVDLLSKFSIESNSVPLTSRESLWDGLHIDHLLQLPFLKQRNESGCDDVGTVDVGVEHGRQVVPSA